MEEDVEIESLLNSNEEFLMLEASKLREDECEPDVSKKGEVGCYLSEQENSSGRKSILKENNEETLLIKESSVVSNSVDSCEEMNYNDEVQELLNDHIVSYKAEKPTKQVLQLNSMSSDEENDRSEYEIDGNPFINEMMSQSEQFEGSFMEHVKRVFHKEKVNEDSQTKCSAVSELTSAYSLILERENILKGLELKFQEKLYSVEENIQCTRDKILSLNDKTGNNTKVPSYSRSYFKKFGAPYFKDANGFGPLPNEDHVSKLKTHQTEVIFLENPCYWTKDHQDMLVDAMKETLTIEKSEKLLKEIRKINEIFVESPEKKNDNVLLENLAKYEKELNIIKNKSFKELISDEDQDREYDWMKYSVSLFDGEHCPDECKRFWNVYLKPSINKSNWEYSEDMKLLNIAEQMDLQDWDSIAKLLGTNRSAYQCFVHFQTRLNGSHNFSKGRWTKEEDQKLLDVINATRIGNFIPWTKVCCHMTKRNHIQIYNRFRKSLDPKLIKGRFTRGEDLLIAAGIEVFACSYKELSSLLINRSSDQIRERYERYLLPKYKRVGTWSLEEDEQLMRLVEKHGEQNWAQISKVMKIRTRTQIRQRYRFIQQNMETKTGWSINNIKRKNIKIIDKSLERTKKAVEKIKKQTKKIEQTFNLSKIEKDTFRIERLKELRNSILMKPYKSKQKKRKPEDSLNINKLLDEYFKNNQIKSPKCSKINKHVADKHYFDELNMLARNLGYEIQIPDDEDEILNNPRLSNSLKNVLVNSLHSKPLDPSVQSNIGPFPTPSGSHEAVIDYIPPESDMSTIVNESWFNPPIDISRLNFSELFKPTVFDYSCGMHRDIWKSKVRQSVQLNVSCLINNVHETPNQQLYNLPLNHLTTLCLKSALLSKTRLKHDCEKEKSRPFPVDETESNINSDVDINNYLNIFQETVLTLFTWPRALSLSSTSIFNIWSSSDNVSLNKSVVNLPNQSNVKAVDKLKQANLKQIRDIKRENLLVKRGVSCKRKFDIEHLLSDVKHESDVNPHLFNELSTILHSQSTTPKMLKSNNENISPASHFMSNKSQKCTVNNKTKFVKKLARVKEGLLKSSGNTNENSKKVADLSLTPMLRTYVKRKVDSSSISNPRKKINIDSIE